MSKKPERVDEYRLKVSKTGKMLVDAWIYAGEDLKIEDEAVQQLCNGATLPSVVGAFAMPDIHKGYGVPIGCVLGLEDIICPAAVGYDINCGMRLLKTPLEAKDVDVKKLADSVSRDLPLGEGKSNIAMNSADFERIAEQGVPALLEIPDAMRNHRAFKAFDEVEIAEDIKRIEANGSMQGDLSGVGNQAIKRGQNQLGTLGGGNHFVEFQIVDKIFDAETAEKFGLHAGQLTVMIHTGSRGFGHQICDDFSKIARKETGNLVVDKELSFFPVESYHGEKYIGAMQAAANFAFANREFITLIVRANIRHYYKKLAIDLLYDVTHNIVKCEQHFGKTLWVHRKGTTRAFTKERMQGTEFAKTGQPVLIPGSMGTGSYVLVGTEESAKTFHSVNHGAGRVMSRKAAAGGKFKSNNPKEPLISDAAFEKSMQGVYLICENQRFIKEEAPAAYKDIDAVIETVTGAGLAKAVARLRPLAVLKG